MVQEFAENVLFSCNPQPGVITTLNAHLRPALGKGLQVASRRDLLPGPVLDPLSTRHCASRQATCIIFRIRPDFSHGQR